MRLDGGHRERYITTPYAMLYFHSYSIIICFIQIVLSRTSGLTQMYRDAVNNVV
jgi:hypothetical protein